MKMQQNFGETIGQAEENDVFDLFACFSYARAQDLDQPLGNLGIVSNQRGKVAAFDDHQFAIVDSNGVGGPLPAVEKSDLSEKLARNHQIEYCVFSLFGRRADSHRAGPHCVKLRPDIPFPEYHRTSFDFRRDDPWGQAVDDRITQVPEKRMRPKQSLLVERLRLRTYPRRHRDSPASIKITSQGYHIGPTNAQTRPDGSVGRISSKCAASVS